MCLSKYGVLQLGPSSDLARGIKVIEPPLPALRVTKRRAQKNVGIVLVHARSWTLHFILHPHLLSNAPRNTISNSEPLCDTGVHAINDNPILLRRAKRNAKTVALCLLVYHLFKALQIITPAHLLRERPFNKTRLQNFLPTIKALDRSALIA